MKKILAPSTVELAGDTTAAMGACARRVCAGGGVFASIQQRGGA